MASANGSTEEVSIAHCTEWEEPPTVLAARIASRFDLPRPIEAFEFPDKGNINQQTFLIEAGSGKPRAEYLLQQINPRVFTRPDWVMAAMIACIEAQRKGLAQNSSEKGGWEPITLVPTRQGDPFLQYDNRRGRSVWRLMTKIADCRSYKSLSDIPDRSDRLKVAEEAGRGLAIYGDLTADMDTSGLKSPLPGYRDTSLYFAQLNSVLAGNRSYQEAEGFLPRDPYVLRSAGQHYLVHLSPEESRRRLADPAIEQLVELAKENEEFAMTLLRAMDAGKVRKVAIHGDTKLDNFLFSNQTGRVRALVDLDTIMPHTWLVDWGDMVRSLSNVAGEKERDLAKVGVDEEIFGALAKGFLGAATRAVAAEIGLMVEAVQIIALELGVRFLTDYLRGDNYFKRAATDPVDLNKVRASVQLNLFKTLSQRSDELRERVALIGKGSV